MAEHNQLYDINSVLGMSYFRTPIYLRDSFKIQRQEKLI